MRSAQTILSHLGIRGKVSRNTLANANQVRGRRIYAGFAQVLITKARKLYKAESFGVELDQTVYALDATIIDLCLSLFPWAEFRKHKGAIKLHTLVDLRGSIPPAAIVTHCFVIFHIIETPYNYIICPGDKIRQDWRARR